MLMECRVKQSNWGLMGFLMVGFVLGCASDEDTDKPFVVGQSTDMASIDMASVDMASVDMGLIPNEPRCLNVNSGPYNESILKTMVYICLEESPDGDCPNYAARSGCGPIGTWNTSNVEGMVAVFEGKEEFNQDLGGWDVSNVGSMERMFKNATQYELRAFFVFCAVVALRRERSHLA
jgi:hypothetical protein